MDAPIIGTLKTAIGAGTTGSDIERRLAALESAFRVAADGYVTIACKQLYIKAASVISIDSGSSMAFKGALSVSLQSAGNLTLKGTTINVESSSQLKLKGSSTVDIEAPGAVSLKGATVRLNLGGKPMARVDDPVVNGVIKGGNPSVFA